MYTLVHTRITEEQAAALTTQYGTIYRGLQAAVALALADTPTPEPEPQPQPQSTPPAVEPRHYHRRTGNPILTMEAGHPVKTWTCTCGYPLH